jgi:hypothetical protein
MGLTQAVQRLLARICLPKLIPNTDILPRPACQPLACEES